MTEEGIKHQVSGLALREVDRTDLPIFYDQQLDPVSIHMAAFTVKDPADRQAFAAFWTKVTTDPTIIPRTILFEGQVVGSILSFEQFGEREITYWLDQLYWGRGLATAALALFLNVVENRPLFGRAAKDNVASIRVMQKCGFIIDGEDTGFANGRGKEIEEYILRLD